MLSRAPWSCGFLLNGFPRNASQADMFVNEICDVDVIIYLTCNIPMMISRSQFKSETRKLHDIKEEISHYQKNISRGIKKYNAKIERFDSTKAAPDILFPKIQSAIDVRVFSEGNEREHPATALTVNDIHD
ncbi:PREDICTED: adenylate kinase isoenzyme 5-like [Nicrophorus vespilloides]|uniref:Adenylate kinase isoenzyme 5-like n=1 Tax=Nicrophorus vespilloides TaxID=110193 RepID=A0ABM1MGY0_NICVS|nr:PREDICTED: adenylate kinase isoenzyme 5-like [Nicrophorus vespilloides]